MCVVTYKPNGRQPAKATLKEQNVPLAGAAGNSKNKTPSLLEGGLSRYYYIAPSTYIVYTSKRYPY